MRLQQEMGEGDVDRDVLWQAGWTVERLMT